MDYYAVLGLENNCTANDIKAQYRRLARECHPDVNPAAAEQATRRLRELNEAYAVLSDPKRRRMYDTQASVDQGKSDPGTPVYVWTKPPSDTRPLSVTFGSVAVGAIVWILWIFARPSPPPAPQNQYPPSTVEMPFNSRYQNDYSSQQPSYDYGDAMLTEYRVRIGGLNQSLDQAQADLNQFRSEHVAAQKIVRMGADITTLQSMIQSINTDVAPYLDGRSRLSVSGASHLSLELSAARSQEYVVDDDVQMISGN